MEKTLFFHPAWLKTMSNKDKILIEKTFNESNLISEKITFTTLRIAKNYKNELLVIVLIQNGLNQDVEFNKKELLYIENEEVKASQKFTLPMNIQSYTSTPWTFIFTTSAISCAQLNLNGKLLLNE
jgi:SLAP domain-containing protein